MVNIGEYVMSKARSSQKKVSLSELNNHTVNNKRQAMKDLKKKGMIINEANVPAFAAAVKPVYKSYSDKYGSSMINAILDTK